MRRAPYAVLGAGAALATAVITAATYEAGLAGTGAESNPIVYLWVCLFSFYFFSRRHALAQLAFAGACFGALLIADAPAETVVTRWLTAMTTLLVAGLLIAMLRDRLEGAVAEMSRRATRDPLTGALNRRGLEGRFQQELARSMRDRAPFSVAALDVDQLKAVNDSLGHPAGDHLLRSVADALEAETRGIDTIARVGGDEFAILMPGVSREEATLAAERLRRAIAAKVVTGEEPVRVTLGGGDRAA
jgi:diguanylate cyclase (GGDEF)-like protein